MDRNGQKNGRELREEERIIRIMRKNEALYPPVPVLAAG